MKPEAQQIAIMEACGWQLCQSCQVWYPPNLHPMANVFGHVAPDYLNDLNAMHSALIHAYKTQPAGWAARFEEILNEVCSRRQYPQWFAWCAEAQDLAKAFIKSLNLWTES